MVGVSGADRDSHRVDRVRGSHGEDRVNVPRALFLGLRSAASRAADNWTGIGSGVYVDVVVVELVGPRHAEAGAFAGIIARRDRHREGVAVGSASARALIGRNTGSWNPVPAHPNAGQPPATPRPRARF